MLISSMNPDTLSREQITRLVFDGMPQPNNPADCVFVFGGRSEVRAAKAVELYHAGMAPHVHLTDGTKWGECEIPQERETHAASLGVQDEQCLQHCSL